MSSGTPGAWFAWSRKYVKYWSCDASAIAWAVAVAVAAVAALAGRKGAAAGRETGRSNGPECGSAANTAGRFLRIAWRVHVTERWYRNARKSTSTGDSDRIRPGKNVTVSAGDTATLPAGSGALSPVDR